MKSMNDDELSRRFRALRASDETSAASFEWSVKAGGPARRAARTTWVRMAAVGMVCALLLVGTYSLAQNHISKRQRAAVNVADWRARSDKLLESAHSPLFRMIDPLSSSVVDTILP